MPRRKWEAEGDFGDYVDPQEPGALYRACMRVLGGPSRATIYRYCAERWNSTLPTEPGSSAWTFWSWSGEEQPVTHVDSVAASANSFGAARIVAGYANRGQRGESFPLSFHDVTPAAAPVAAAPGAARDAARPESDPSTSG